MFTPAPRHRLPDVTLQPMSDMGGAAHLGDSWAITPASGTWATGSQAYFWPICPLEPFVVSKAFWLNGATVGTDSIDLGVYRMTDQSTGRMDLLRSTGLVLSAGSANVVQETATFRVAAKNLTSGNDSTDATTYTSASVTLKAGRLYLLSFTNTAASAAAASSITGGSGGVPTFTSRASTQFNGTAHRVSVWSAVPTADYTGTLIINFGSTQTGSTWAVNEFSGVDTATDDGTIQPTTATGSSTTPSVTLAAFGSSANATFGALANNADTTTTPGTGFTELSDSNATTPVQCLETEFRGDNDTSVDGTITSSPWGAIALEIKADASTFVIPPAMPGISDLYIAMSISGTTATVFRSAPTGTGGAGTFGFTAASCSPLPSSVTATGLGGNTISVPVAGFSLRSLIG